MKVIDTHVHFWSIDRLRYPWIERGSLFDRSFSLPDYLKRAGLRPPQLLRVKARFRNMTGPLLQLIGELQRKNRQRLIAVLLPEVVKRYWWQYLLHNQRLRRMQTALLRYGGSRIVVMIIPWHLEEPRIEEGLEQEETPATAARVMGQ